VQAPIRTAVAVALIAGAWVVSGLPTGPGQAPAGEFDPSVRVNLSDHCIEAGQFAHRHHVTVTVRDRQNDVVWSAPDDAKTDADGFISFGREPVVGDLYCEPPSPPDLSPGMKVTVDDGTTRKALVLRDVTVDDLDPNADTMTGTAPEGPHIPDSTGTPDLWFSAWNANNRGTAEAEIRTHPGGRWFVNFRSEGGDVEPDAGAGAGVIAWDEDNDGTVADRFLTAVSLQASSADSRAAVVLERGTKVQLTGRLSAGKDDCTRRKRVRLLDVTGNRSKGVRSARTNRRGRYAFTKRVKRTTTFKVRYGGGKRCQRSASRARTVRAAG
jgi:hypothetical protein